MSHPHPSSPWPPLCQNCTTFHWPAEKCPALQTDMKQDWANADPEKRRATEDEEAASMRFYSAMRRKEESS